MAPARRVTVRADDERLKLVGLVTVSVTAVVLLRVPEVPVTVMVWDPGAAALLAAKFSELTELVVAGLNVAVTPVGTADTAKATSLLKPFCPVTLMVLLALAPAGRLRLPDDGKRLKLGAIGVFNMPFEQPVSIGNKEAAQKITSNLNQSDFRTGVAVWY